MLLHIMQQKRIQLLITLLLCGGIVLAGSFAWFSVTQNVRNEFFGYLPSVNLHDDFKEPNKDIYVENTSGEPVLVRVKLLEYMEYGPGSDPTKIKLPTGARKDILSSWQMHTDPLYAHPQEDKLHEYWQWKQGGQKWYVPANTDQATASPPMDGEVDGRIVKDPRSDAQLREALASMGLLNAEGSLLDNTAKSHITTLGKNITDFNLAMNGHFASNPVGISSIQTARNDVLDSQNRLNEYLDTKYADPSNDGNIVEEKRIRYTRYADVYTMDEWVKGFDPTDDDKRPAIAANQLGDFWVIDDNGWAYWASPLESGTATGLLVNSVTATPALKALKNKGNRYYYAIDVSMQAATAERHLNDLEDPDDNDNYTGFWRHPQVVGNDKATETAQLLLEDVAEIARIGMTATTREFTSNTVDTVSRGKYWYLVGDVWYYDDGRWSFDGVEWLLDGEPFDFDPNGWATYDDELWYVGEDWFFDSDRWYYMGIEETVPPIELPPEELPPEEKPPETVTPPDETTPPEEKPPETVTPPDETTQPEEKPPETVTPPDETNPPEEKPPEVVTPPEETTPPAPPVEP